MIHLVDQIFVLGPTYMHHIYPYERHMLIMKDGYTTEEVIECCIDYMKDGNSIGVLIS
jgi:hypothetical protein